MQQRTGPEVRLPSPISASTLDLSALLFSSVQEAAETGRRLDAGEVLDPSVALESAADQSVGWLTVVCAADNAANAAAWADAEARAAARGVTTAALACFLCMNFVDTDGEKQNLTSMLWEM